MTTTGLTTEEIAFYRSRTPGCRRVVHFNHAGASLMPIDVIRTITDYVWEEATLGGYEAADDYEEQILDVYRSAATLIGAAPAEIAIVENATRAWDMAFYSLPFESGDRILTSMSEYASNVIALLQIASRGVRVEVVPNDEFGQLSIVALSDMLDKDVKLVAVSHMPTNGGLVQPIAEIGALTRSASVPFLVDACQTIGQMPLHVDLIHCDMLSATSRKYLRGPRGCGFLYVRQSTLPDLIPPMLDLHAAKWTSPTEYVIEPGARRFENWEKHVAGMLGMGTAIDYALNVGLENIWIQIRHNADYLRHHMESTRGVSVHDLGAVRGGIVTFTVDGRSAAEVVDRLRLWRINTVTSSVFSTRFDMESRGLTELVRASVHYFTSAAELDLLLEAVEEIAGETWT